MNSRRLILSILAVFVGIFLTDFFIHGFWLKPDYDATKDLWRSEAEMQKHFPWLLLGQFVIAIIFTVIWAKAFANWGTASSAFTYGGLMGAFLHSTTFISHAVTPLPSHIMGKWVVSGVIQMALVGLLLFAVYKPLPARAEA